MMAALVLILALVWSPAGAVLPDEMLADPVLEARARDISKNLRCLVCQNQSIDDSNAGLARDLRIVVRKRLVAGDSDGAVIEFVVARYGDFVLLNPPFKATTYVLWIGPGVIGILGLLAVVVFFRRRRATADGGAPAPLSDEEKKLLDALIEDRPR
jgi:cytochrome c-type biogenesis protein CcmH